MQFGIHKTVVFIWLFVYLQRDSSSPRVLFEKLDPKFVSKYAIGSPSHDYLWAMSAMVKVILLMLLR
jgi:hypothetical protein